jgi:long-chain acyl-CoA synthetase
MNNIFSFLQDSAALYPDKVFIVDKGNPLTFAEVRRRAVALAGTFSGLGVKAGDRVLIYLDNSHEYIEAYFAVLYLGAVAVPINKNLTMDVVRFIAEDADPVLIVTNSVFRKRLAEGNAVSGATGLPEGLILNLDSLGAEDQRRSPLPPDNGVELPDNDAKSPDDGDTPALFLYTSGTTRMPKGVVLTHKNLRANTESIVSYLGLGEKDSLLAVVNFCYSYGNSLLLTHARAGATLFIENRISYPIKIIEQLSGTKATGFSTVGSYLNILLKQEFLKPEHLKSLRYVTFAGESTSFDDIMKLKAIAPCVRVFVMYGQTEASARLSYLEPELIVKKRGSIGKSIPGVTLRVVSETGEDVPPGETGEIIASGDNIMRGYWNNPEATGEVLRDGWLYTGDLAVTDEEGFLYIKGRKDDMIKYLGHRISPVEIEAAVNSGEGVLESAVVAVTEGSETRIKAFVVPQGGTVDLARLAAHVKKLLPPFKNPHAYELIEALPRTASGKIRRGALKTSQ